MMGVRLKVKQPNGYKHILKIRIVRLITTVARLLLGAGVKRTIQVRVSRGEKYYVAECLDLPVVTQAATLDELALNIREAISLHLEGEDFAELGLSDNPTILATMELDAEA